jgi:phospholipid transport system substrate-binding protein
MNTISTKKILGAAVLLIGAFAGSAATAQAPDPAVQQVQTFYDALLDSMKHAKELGTQGRYSKLKPVIEQTFDLTDMASISVGPDKWTALSPADQQALTAAFERLTVANYAKNFDGYDGEKFVVEPASTVRGTDRVVQSKLVAKTQTVPFGYRMRQAGGAWKILDIYLNGNMSQLAIQRSEYAATFAAGGAAGLAKKLDEKSAQLLRD